MAQNGNFYSSVAVRNVQTVQLSQKLHILVFKQFSIASRFNESNGQVIIPINEEYLL